MKLNFYLFSICDKIESDISCLLFIALSVFFFVIFCGKKSCSKIENQNINMVNNNNLASIECYTRFTIASSFVSEKIKNNKDTEYISLVAPKDA